MGQNKNFTDIMEEYRRQPQAARHVYRSVLLYVTSSSSKTTEKENEKRAEGTAPPTPTKLAATSTVAPDGEERGDLIKFYNTVYVERLQEFVIKFKQRKAGREGEDVPPLSPLPKLRAHPQSPCRRVSDHASVYIRNLKATTTDVVASNPHSPNKPLSYQFSRSPAKDLRAINALMRTEGERRAAASNIGKRLLVDDAGEQQPQQMVLIQEQEGEGEPPAKMKIVAAANGAAAGESRWSSRLGLVLEDRQQQVQQQQEQQQQGQDQRQQGQEPEPEQQQEAAGLQQ